MSRLKFDNLIAAKTGNKKAISATNGNEIAEDIVVCSIDKFENNVNNIKEGANPEVIKSAILSSCNPKSFSDLKILAKPSKKSRNTPRKIKIDAISM